MKYWDASTIVSLLVDEEATPGRRRVLEQDPRIVTWWCSKVECASALTRLQREGHLDEEGVRNGLAALETLSKGWTDIEPTETVRKRALRLLRTHPLRAADALQLAAALVASGEDPGSLSMVCADARLVEAARKEGFAVLD